MLKDILGRLFAARGWGRRQEQLRLELAWSKAAQAAGPHIAEQTRVSSLRPRGVLEVIVANATLMQELTGFHKGKLLEQLRKNLPGMVINNLRFKAGRMD